MNGRTLAKIFKIFHSGLPEEWIQWQTNYNEVCVGMSITSGSERNRMVHPMLWDEPLKEFEQMLATYQTETVVNNNHSLDSSVAMQIFATNA
jgi:hypothetical protein